MKKEAGILLAGGVALLAVLSLISIRKILTKKENKYSDAYADYQWYFEDKDRDDEYYGIEFYALK